MITIQVYIYMYMYMYVQHMHNVYIQHVHVHCACICACVLWFTIRPHTYTVDSYPTLQLLVGGVGVCLDTAVLEFVKHITHHLPRTRLMEVESGVGVKQTGGEFGVQASHHSGETVTMDTPTPSVPEDAPTGDEHFSAKLKLYAAKVFTIVSPHCSPPHTHTHTHTHTLTHSHTCTYTHTHKHMYTHTHTYTHVQCIATYVHVHN